MNKTILLVVTALCIVLALGIWQLCRYYPLFDRTALLVADLLMYGLTLAAFAMNKESGTARPQAFVRGVYGATMLRLFVCLVGFVGYALFSKGHLYKPTLFVMFGIYVLYMAVETIVASRRARG